jgi:hypothetical protein
MTVFFIAARRERGERVFKTGEWALAGAVVILACLAAAKLVSQATAG